MLCCSAPRCSRGHACVCARARVLSGLMRCPEVLFPHLSPPPSYPPCSSVSIHPRSLSLSFFPCAFRPLARSLGRIGRMMTVETASIRHPSTRGCPDKRSRSVSPAVSFSIAFRFASLRFVSYRRPLFSSSPDRRLSPHRGPSLSPGSWC